MKYFWKGYKGVAFVLAMPAVLLLLIGVVVANRKDLSGLSHRLEKLSEALEGFCAKVKKGE
jgi:hypothetical protein